MPRRINLLNPDREVELRMEVERAKSMDDAILAALRIHVTPLTFNDLMELMPDKLKHQERLSRALKRLLRQKRIQKVIVVTVNEVIKAYALMTDTRILVSIPVSFIREEGYEVSIGFRHEEPKEPYDLYEVKADYILIHINPSKSPDQQG